jgi:hypothetical protein
MPITETADSTTGLVLKLLRTKRFKGKKRNTLSFHGAVS